MSSFKQPRSPEAEGRVSRSSPWSPRLPEGPWQALAGWGFETAASSAPTVWTGSTAYNSAATLSSYQNRSPTPSNSSRRRAPASDSGSNVGYIACAEEGCNWLSKTPSDHKKHMARHKLRHVCEVDDCARSDKGKGFATVNDLNRHKMTVHKNLLPGARMYRCFAPNCSKPKKDWPRKDNFKSHLRKTHPNEDVDDLLRRSEDWWNSKHDEVAQQRSSDATPHRGTQKLSAWVPQTTIGTVLDPQSFLFPSPHSAQVQPPPLPFMRTNLQAASRPYGSSHSLAASKSSNIGDWTTNIITVTPASFMTRSQSFNQGGFYAPNQIYPKALGLKGVSIAHTVADPTFLEQDRFEMSQEWYSQADQGAAVQEYPEFSDPLAHIGHDASELLSHWHSSAEQDMPQSVLESSTEQSAIISDTVPNFESLKTFIASFEHKVNNELERTAIRSALRALESTASAAPSTDGEMDDYNEKSVEEAGKTGFSCKWPTCSSSKRRWNLRSEFKKHMRRHTAPYGCTFEQCYCRFGSKNDWIRHEVKRHTQQEYWRCDLKDSSGPYAQNCRKTFQLKKHFIAHLESAHQIIETREVTRLSTAQKINAGFQPQYWCGFCKGIRKNSKKGKEGYHERYNHIAEHITGEGRCIDDWVSPEGTPAKQALRQYLELVAETRDEASDTSLESPSSEGSVSADGGMSALPGDALPWNDPASVLRRRRGAKRQIESADFLMSQKGLRSNELNASHIQQVARASTGPRDLRKKSFPASRERSTSQSSRLGSRDSEGEREFMGLAVDCGSNAGLSPSFAIIEDHEVIASTVAQLVQAYLRVLNLQPTNSRQCANSCETSWAGHSTGESSDEPTTRPPARIDTNKDRKRARQKDDDDLEDDDNPSKRTKIIEEEIGNKSFACPYSKHDKARYSEMNTDTQEKTYRRCASKYLTDISRLKQHLYRTHKRPDSYCGRCFGTFTSQYDLEEHSRMHPPCPVVVCPFPEKMTHDQKTIIKRKGDVKDQVRVWFFVYETLFPGSTKPSSPYVEVVSIDAAASFQQWYDSAETVATFRVNFDSRIAEAFPDTSVQFRIQMIHEECLSELVWQRGPNFHSGTGYEILADPPDLSAFLPSSSSAGQPFEQTESTPYTDPVVATSSLSMPSDQTGVTEQRFPVLGSGETVPKCTADNGTDFTMQESLPALDRFSRSTSEVFEEVDGPLLQDHLQDLYALNTMASGYSLDYDGVPGHGTLTLDTSDAEDVDASSIENQTEDHISRKKRGKCRAWE